MAELLAPEDLPNHVPGHILAKSDGLGWKGVALRAYAYKGQDVEIPPMRDFMLVSYRTGVTPMERRFHGKWTQTVCGPGSVSLLTRSEQSHWHWTEDVNVTHVYLAQDFVSNIAGEVSGRAVEDVALADVLRTDDAVMTTAVNAIAQEVADPGLGGDLYIEAVARQLVIHLLRKYAEVRLRPPAKAGQLCRAQRDLVLDYIHGNLHRSLELKEIAAQVNMAACTFSRYFRRTFGVAPYAYVIERRLDRARRMLSETAKPTKEVATVCGFSDQAHLTRLFARRYGTTPSAFRNGSSAAVAEG
ncbi:MAG: helix-turn-helix domain-containing protein [Geminicoccaceae bacterium]